MKEGTAFCTLNSYLIRVEDDPRLNSQLLSKLEGGCEPEEEEAVETDNSSSDESVDASAREIPRAVSCVSSMNLNFIAVYSTSSICPTRSRGGRGGNRRRQFQENTAGGQ